MTEQPTAHEEQESKEQQRNKAYQTLLAIQALQIEELQSNPEKSILEIRAIYEDVIKKEAEKNPIIWELYQPEQIQRPEIKTALEEDRQRATGERGTKRLTQETVQKIWDNNADLLSAEEQEKLKIKIEKKLGFIVN